MPGGKIQYKTGGISFGFLFLKKQFVRSTELDRSRAANGAIIITTKSGKISVDISSTVSFSQILKTPKYQSTFGQGWDGQHYLQENGSWGPKFDGKPRLWGNAVDNSQLLKPFSFQKDRSCISLAPNFAGVAFSSVGGVA